MKQIPKKQIDVKKVISRLLNGDIVSLSKAITIVESDNVKDISNSNKIISSCLKNRTNSIRIGITGVPGVGKSTFIEAFGNQLTEQGHKVAVLAIDPTSTVSHGSIMGDKTRMNTLVNNKKAFIRPSPASSHYGGVAKKTRESIILCEAAGYNIIIVETVGVGQNEISVSEMVDIFLLLKLSGAGDELQGIKRGIIEMADVIIINKADGDNIDESNKAMAEFSMALKLYPTKKSNWVPKVLACSSINNSGIEPVWKLVLKYISDTKDNKFFAENRKHQNKYWLLQTINDKLQSDLAKALMSIPAAKGIEIGSGFSGTLLKGSEHNDAFKTDSKGKIHTETNRSGGIQGGISNGEEIVVRIGFKPVSTINKEQNTVTRDGEETTISGKGRHDPCVLPRAVPIVEAMVALVLGDHLLRQRSARI